MAAGMVPIAAPASPSANVPRNEPERLELAFKEARDQAALALQTARGRRIRDARERMGRFVSVSENLGRLKIFGQTRRNLRTLRETAHRELIEGALANDTTRVSQGCRITQAIESYHRVEDRQAAVYDILSRLYPHTSTQGIRLEYASAARNLRGQTLGDGLYEPSLEFMRDLAIVRTYQRLSHGTPEERTQAAAIERVIADVNNPPFFLDPDSVDFLETETRRLSTIYEKPENGPDSLRAFFSNVHHTQLQDLEQNPGYRNRRALEASLDHLETHARTLNLLEDRPGSLPPVLLENLKNDLLQSARTLREQMTQTLRNLETERPPRTVRFQENGHWMTEEVPSTEPSAAEIAYRSQLERIEGQIRQLENFDATSPSATELMRRHLRIIGGFEEDHVRHLMGRETRLLSQNLPDIPLSGNAADRARLYRQRLNQTDIALMRQTIQARIDMYRNMTSTVHRADRALQAIGSIGDLGTVNSTGNFHAVVERYRRIDRMIEDGRVDQAQRELTSLEQAQIGAHLQDHFEVSSHVNTAASIGIIAASAASMNIGGFLLAPELALSASAANATWATRALYTAATAPIFRLTHNGLDAWISDDSNIFYRTPRGDETLLRNIADNTAHFARQTGNDIGMMITMQTAMGQFQALGRSRLQNIAQRQLLAEGRIASGTLTPEMQNLVAQRALELGQNIGTQAAMHAGGFASELAALQAWGFGSEAVGSRIDTGSWEFGQAFRRSFLDVNIWKEQGVFVLGMRAGAVLTSPILSPLHEGARDIAVDRVRDRYEAVMARSETAGRAWTRYLETGEGNPDTIFKNIESALERRLELLRNPAIRDVVRPEAVGETEAALHQIREERAGLRLQIPFWMRSLAGSMGILAADGGGRINPATSVHTEAPQVPPSGASPSTSAGARRGPTASTGTNLRLRTIGLIGVILDMPEVVASYHRGSPTIEVATSDEGFESARAHIVQKARSLGLRGVRNLGSEDLVFESPLDSSERLTVHFTRLQGETTPNPTHAARPESTEASANPSFIAARNLQRTLRERGIPFSTVSYDPQSRRLILRTARGADLIADGDLIESLLPDVPGRNLHREDPGDGRHILRVTHADGSPLLIIEVTRRDITGQPPPLPAIRNQVPETSRARRNRRTQASSQASSVPKPPIPASETPPSPRTIPRTTSGIRTPQALASWFIKRLHVVDPQTATRAVIPDHIDYDEANHRVVVSIPESQLGAANAYISLLLRGRAFNKSQSSPDTLILRVPTFINQPELTIEITGNRSYRSPVSSEASQPATPPPGDAAASPPAVPPNPQPIPPPGVEPQPATPPPPTSPPAPTGASAIDSQTTPPVTNAASAPPPRRRGRHPLTTGVMGAVAPVFLGTGGIGGSMARRGTPAFTIVGNRNGPTPVTIGNHHFEVIRQGDRWALQGPHLPSGQRWRVVRQGTEVKDLATLREGFRDGDEVSLVEERWGGLRSDHVLGKFVFHEPLLESPPAPEATVPTRDPVTVTLSPEQLENFRASYPTSSLAVPRPGEGIVIGRNEMNDPTISRNNTTLQRLPDGTLVIRDGTTESPSRNGTPFYDPRTGTTVRLRGEVRLGPGESCVIGTDGNRVVVHNPWLASHLRYPHGTTPHRLPTIPATVGSGNPRSESWEFPIEALMSGGRIVIGRGVDSSVVINERTVSRSHVTVSAYRNPDGSGPPLVVLRSIADAPVVIDGLPILMPSEGIIVSPPQSFRIGGADMRIEMNGGRLRISQENPEENVNRRHNESGPAAPASVDDATLADGGEATNPQMRLPAFVGMDPNVNLVTVGGVPRGTRGTTNIAFPEVNPQPSPPVIFRKDGNDWVLNTLPGSFVSINGTVASNGDRIHLGDRLRITIPLEGRIHSHTATVTDRGLEIDENSSSPANDDTPLQAAARTSDDDVRTPPRGPRGR